MSDEPEVVGGRAACGYQRMGDPHPNWMREVLLIAKDKKLIYDFEVTGFYGPGIHGLEYYTFWVDLLFQDHPQIMNEYDKAQEYIKSLLNEQIIHDSDVEVSFLIPLYKSKLKLLEDPRDAVKFSEDDPRVYWFINENGDVYPYPGELQEEHFPNDDHFPYPTEEAARLAAQP